MRRLIDETELEKYIIHDGCEKGCGYIDERDLPYITTVEAIPKEEVGQFIQSIQKIKDDHNEYGTPINYGTICGILIEGYRLLDKYKTESED